MRAEQSPSTDRSLAVARLLERDDPTRALSYLEPFLSTTPDSLPALAIAERIYARLALQGPAAVQHAMNGMEVRLRRSAMTDAVTGAEGDEASDSILLGFDTNATRATTIYIGRLRTILNDRVLPCILSERSARFIKQSCDAAYLLVAMAIRGLSHDTFWLDLRAGGAWVDDSSYRSIVASLLNASRAYEIFDLSAASSSYREAYDDRNAGLSRAAHCWAVYGKALLQFHDRDYQTAVTTVRDVLPVARAASYKSLTARIYGLLALSHLRTEHYEDALAAYRNMLELNDAAGTADEIGHTAASVAQVYLMLGHIEDGWPFLGRALNQFSSMTTERRRRLVLLNAAQYAQHAGRPRTSVHLFTRAIVATKRWGAQEFLAEDLARRALAQWSLGDIDAARHDAETAASRLRGVRQHAESSWFVAFVSAAKGITGAEGSAQAVRQLDRALRYFTKAESPLVPHLRLALAKHLAQSGERQRSLLEVSQALEQLSVSASTTSQVMLEAAIFSDHWPWYAAVLETSFPGINEVVRALEIFRSIGNRSVPMRIKDGRILVRRAQALLRHGDRLIFLLELKHSLRVVVVSSTGIETRPPEPRLDALVDDARHYARAVREHTPTNGPAHQRVERFVSRLVTDVPVGSRVFLYLTGQLAHLPLEGVQIGGGRHLGGEYEVVRLQSLASLPPPVAGARPSPRGLIVTAGSQGQARHLPALPSVDGEARDVLASVANSATWLRESGATRDRVLAVVPTVTFVHYAGHLLPTRSGGGALVLAGGALLGLDDLTTVDLSGLDLVFLATCASAGGVTMQGNGGLNMASGAASRGARSVIGSLWDLRDREAGPIVREFYKRYGNGVTAGSALREARLAALRQGVSPGSAWSMVVIRRGIE